jgi:hypothetical protein
VRRVTRSVFSDGNVIVAISSQASTDTAIVKHIYSMYYTTTMHYFLHAAWLERDIFTGSYQSYHPKRIIVGS